MAHRLSSRICRNCNQSSNNRCSVCAAVRRLQAILDELKLPSQSVGSIVSRDEFEAAREDYEVLFRELARTRVLREKEMSCNEQLRGHIVVSEADDPDMQPSFEEHDQLSQHLAESQTIVSRHERQNTALSKALVELMKCDQETIFHTSQK